jgi:hypothetical protein
VPLLVVGREFRRSKSHRVSAELEASLLASDEPGAAANPDVVLS